PLPPDLPSFPTRRSSDLGDRDRDRGGPRRDRGDRGPSGPPAPVVDAGGPATQTAPADLPRPGARPTGPILPPLMSPQQPSWKQEDRKSTRLNSSHRTISY